MLWCHDNTISKALLAGVFLHLYLLAQFVNKVCIRQRLWLALTCSHLANMLAVNSSAKVNCHLWVLGVFWDTKLMKNTHQLQPYSECNRTEINHIYNSEFPSGLLAFTVRCPAHAQFSERYPINQKKAKTHLKKPTFDPGELYPSLHFPHFTPFLSSPVFPSPSLATYLHWQVQITWETAFEMAGHVISALCYCILSECTHSRACIHTLFI